MSQKKCDVLCIGPNPITRSLDSPHKEFRNFRVFREFGVTAICTMADTLSSKTGVLMSSNFLKPPENQTTLQRPQKSQLSFSNTRNVQTENKFSHKHARVHGNMQSPLLSEEYKSIWQPLFEIHSGIFSIL